MTFRRMMRIRGLGALCWFNMGLAAAQPAEIFFKHEDMRSPVLSPSGTQLAILSRQGEQQVGLVMLHLSTNQPAKPIAYFPDGNVDRIGWMSDDRLLFSVVPTDDGPNRHGSAGALFTVNVDGSARRRLKPDGYRVLRVPASVDGQATERILGVGADSAGDLEPVWLNTQRETTRAYADLNAPPHARQWFADSHGDLRAVLTRHEGRQAAYWRAPGSKSWTQLYESPQMKAPFEIEAVDDVGHLYVTQSNGPEGYHWLTRYDFQTGKPEDRPIVKTPGFDFIGSLVIADGRVQGVRFLVDGESTYWFDAPMRAFQDRVDGIFPDHVNLIDCRHCGTDDMVAVISSYNDRDPGRFYVYQAKPPEGGKTWRPIGIAMKDVEPEQMAGVALHRIAARDGRGLPVWVTRPHGAAGPLPAVVLVHGGPWARGRSWIWSALPQFLASRGYVVIEPEMRGSQGYGDAHFGAGIQQWGRTMQDDVTDALKWAQAQGIASDKACIAGDDYGGYSALMGLADDSAAFRCGIASFAPTDLMLLMQGSMWEVDDIGAEARKFTLTELVGDPDRDAKMLEAQSPTKLAARIKAPVMLVYGERDHRVPISHGERMRNALRNAGNDPVWISYPDGSHGLYYLKDRVDRAQRMEAFLAKYLNWRPTQST